MTEQQPVDGVEMTLPDGQTLQVTVEVAEWLHSRLDEVTNSAYTARRTALAHMAAQAGLTAAEDAAGNPREDAYLLPSHARGSAPYGIPYIAYAYRNDIIDRPARHAKPKWSLRLSGLAGPGFGQCDWDDADGLAGLVQMLRERTAEDFAVEAQLSGGNVFHAPPSRFDEIAAEVEVLLALPAVDSGAMSHCSSWLHVSEVAVFDPATCRMVQVPGVLHLYGRHATLAELDRAAKSAGLVPFTLESRIKGARYVTRADALPTRSRRMSWRLQDALRGRALTGSYKAMILHPKAISVEERNPLLHAARA